MRPDEASTVITNFFFAPAEQAPWPLASRTFEEAARARWPQCSTSHEDPSGEGDSTVSFAMVFDSGAERSGEYAEGQSLDLWGYSPLDAAEFIAWFVTLLPTGIHVRFNNQEAIEGGDYEDHWLPRSQGVRTMAEALATHLAGALS